CFPGNCPDS
uniref:Conopressin-M1 n=1 Tax=Conus miliaris TaxID=97181 RepID=CONO1_CONML|nr:RecName: Full=Conopressin-M1; Short=Con-M1 [Conus miliaris]